MADEAVGRAVAETVVMAQRAARLRLHLRREQGRMPYQIFLPIPMPCLFLLLHLRAVEAVEADAVVEAVAEEAMPQQ